MEEKELAPDGAFCITQTTQEYLDKQLDDNINDNIAAKPTIQETIEYVRGFVDMSKLSIRETNALIGAIISDSKTRHVNSEDYNPEFKWTVNMSVDGLNYMLETGCSAEDALQHVKTVHDKDDFWLKQTRNKPMSRKVRTESIRVVEEVNKETVKRLKKSSHYKKKSLLKATTPSRQMTQMEEVITIADRVDRLESLAEQQGCEILSLRSEIHELQMRVQLSELNIKTLGDTLDIKTIDMREEVMKLKDTCTIEQIAQILGIKERRVKYLVYGK